MSDFMIGEIDPASVPSKVVYKPATSPEYNHDKSTAFNVQILQFLVPLVILSLALAFSYLYTKDNVNTSK
jgi:ABC-type multidrug transport system permease subunit